MAQNSLSIKDNRTGKEYEVLLEDNHLRASDLEKIKLSETDEGLVAYDPGLTNTAVCKSTITFIDGEKGILRYRGYPIEELAEKKSYLEVAYLLIHGELPSETQRKEWTHHITIHTLLHENLKVFMDGFRYDAHPMGILVGTLGALSTFYPDAKNVRDEASRRLQIYRLIAKIPTIAAFAYRHSQGRSFIDPSNDLTYAENFLSMVFRPSTSSRYEADPDLAKALDLLFVLHADHEQNCSTNAMRSVGSSLADPYSCAAAASAALYGPLHGGANEAVVRMLEEIGKVDRIPDIIRDVKAGKRRLMGFGHRVYHNYDPRARIIKKMAQRVFEITGKNPLLDIALELERIALSDDYFISRHLYPNVDFYSGLIYQSMGFPVDMFPVLFAIPRMSGWLAQWQENVSDAEQRIVRPKQVYLGKAERHL
jgi:citrate synthase